MSGCGDALLKSPFIIKREAFLVWLSSAPALFISSFIYPSQPTPEIVTYHVAQLSETVMWSYTGGSCFFESSLDYIVDSGSPELHSRSLPQNTRDCQPPWMEAEFV